MKIKIFLPILFVIALIAAAQRRNHGNSPLGGIAWPPILNENFPDIPFQNGEGKTVRMRDFKGKYVVVYYIGMTCPACQGNERAMDQNFSRYSGGIPLNDDRIRHVEILLFNRQDGPAQPADAASWAAEYASYIPNNAVVLVPPSWTTDASHHDVSWRMVGSTQLIDDQGAIRASVVTPPGGKWPPHLWPDLVAMLAKMLKGETL